MSKFLQSIKNILNLMFIFCAAGSAAMAAQLIVPLYFIFPPLYFLAIGSVVLLPIAIPYGIVRIVIDIKNNNTKNIYFYPVLTFICIVNVIVLIIMNLNS